MAILLAAVKAASLDGQRAERPTVARLLVLRLGQGFWLLDVKIDDVDAVLSAFVRRAVVLASRLQTNVSQLFDPQATPDVR